MTKQQLIKKIRGQRIQRILIGTVDDRRKDVETRAFTLEAIELGNGVVLEFPPYCTGCYKPVTKICSAPDCQKVFLPERSNNQYCSDTCYQRIYYRQLRAEKKAREVRREV